MRRGKQSYIPSIGRKNRFYKMLPAVKSQQVGGKDRYYYVNDNI